MDQDRLFPADPTTRAIARELYAQVRGLPLISPHGHVDPAMLADDVALPDPAALFVTPDHYLTRMLYSQGISPLRLGVPDRDGRVHAGPREAWRTFCEHWYLFRGTPAAVARGVARRDLRRDAPARPATADEVYDEMAARVADPSSGRARCCAGSASRCSPPPIRRSTASSITPSWRPRGGAGRRRGAIPTFRPERRSPTPAGETGWSPSSGWGDYRRSTPGRMPGIWRRWRGGARISSAPGDRHRPRHADRPDRGPGARRRGPAVRPAAAGTPPKTAPTPAMRSCSGRSCSPSRRGCPWTTAS